MIANNADNYKFGTEQVDKIFWGTDLIWPPDRCTTLPNGDKWCFTTNSLNSGDPTGTRLAIQDEFGPTAIPLDWSDLQDYYALYGNVDPLQDILFTNRPRGGVTRNGNWYHSGTRAYFIDEEGKYHNSGFTVHAIIGPGEGPHGYDLLDLGSWRGSRNYYVKIPGNTP